MQMTNLPSKARLVSCEHLIHPIRHFHLASTFLSSSFSSFSCSFSFLLPFLPSFSDPFSFSHFLISMDPILVEMLLVSPNHFCSSAFYSFYWLLQSSSFLFFSSLYCLAFLRDYLLADQKELVQGQLKAAVLDLWSLLHHTLKHICCQEMLTFNTIIYCLLPKKSFFMNLLHFCP